MSGIDGVLVQIVLVGLVLSQHHTQDFRDPAQLQKLPHFLFCQETGGAVGSVREDVEAPWVMGVLVAGKPDVPLFRNETDQQCSYGGDAQPKGREHHASPS
ncbi:hypothetical protein, partial [Duncaniella muris]|uniref:hypothetical protein n=1 Tax=Duncaniella muris TaxID=2094150 RepID=UPI00272A5736